MTLHPLGTTVEVRLFGGQYVTGQITEASTDIKNGQPGYSLSNGHWCYAHQVVRVIEPFELLPDELSPEEDQALQAMLEEALLDLTEPASNEALMNIAAPTSAGDRYARTEDVTVIRIFETDEGWNIDGVDPQGNYTESCWIYETKERALATVPEFCTDNRLDPSLPVEIEGRKHG